LNIGDVVYYCGTVYQISNIKSNPKGLWAQFNPAPSTLEANPCTGIMSDCWFDTKHLKRKS